MSSENDKCSLFIAFPLILYIFIYGIRAQKLLQCSYIYKTFGMTNQTNLLCCCDGLRIISAMIIIFPLPVRWYLYLSGWEHWMKELLACIWSIIDSRVQLVSADTQGIMTLCIIHKLLTCIIVHYWHYTHSLATRGGHKKITRTNIIDDD